MRFRVYRPEAVHLVGVIRRFHTSPPDLVDKSLAFLELSKLCHLSLHCLPVLNDENEFTSSLNHLIFESCPSLSVSL